MMDPPDAGAGREEPLYIAAEPGPLYGVLHSPEGGAPRAAALLLSPGLDERRSAWSPLARLSRALAGAGCAALRFDYYGTGDSGGESLDASVRSMERDARAAARFLRERAGGAPLALVGVRLGGSLALRLGPGLGAARTAAVAPLTSGANWLRQERGRRTLRRSMAARELRREGVAAAFGESPPPAGGAEDLEGLPLSPAGVAELEALDLLAGESPPPAAAGYQALVIQVSPRRSPLGEVAELGRRFGARIECLNLEPFWQPLEHPPLDALADRLAAFVTGSPP